MNLQEDLISKLKKDNAEVIYKNVKLYVDCYLEALAEKEAE